MGFYEDFINGLKGLIGEGKPFRHPTALAEHCNVKTAQITRYLNHERRRNLSALGDILDRLGARLVFPGSTTPGQLVNPLELEQLKEQNKALQKKVDYLEAQIEYTLRAEAARAGAVAESKPPFAKEPGFTEEKTA